MYTALDLQEALVDVDEQTLVYVVVEGKGYRVSGMTYNRETGTFELRGEVVEFIEEG